MQGQVLDIIRYPIKAFSGHRLQHTELVAGKGLSGDRMFAIEKEPSGFNELDPQPIDQSKLLSFSDTKRLADLMTSFDFDTGICSMSLNQECLARGNISQPTGCKIIESFIEQYLSPVMNCRPRFLIGAPLKFTKNYQPYISMINMATIREIEIFRQSKLHLGALRANLVIDTGEPFSEIHESDQIIDIDGVQLEIVQRIEQPYLQMLFRSYEGYDLPKEILIQDHNKNKFFCGVYLQVVKGGVVGLKNQLNMCKKHKA